MKIWIIRLNGKIITEYSRTKIPKVNDEAEPSKFQRISSFSSIHSQTSDQDKTQENLISDYNKRCIITDIIDHSRKLSLTQYDNELNYTRIRSNQYFYMARHKLLFVYVLEDDEHSILAIENILEKLISLYQKKCQSIYGSYKLPNKMTDYQRQEIAKLSFKIDDIIDEEQNVNELIRKESIRDKQQVKFNFVTEFGARNRKINELSERQNEIRRKQVRYIYQIRKKLTRYKIKVGILCLIVLLVGSVCLYFMFTDCVPATKPIESIQPYDFI